MVKCKNNCSLGIFEMVRSIQCRMSGKVDNEAKSFGINSTQMLLIYEIYENKDISLNSLCNRLELPKSTVSRLVDELVKKGILIREIPGENRRIVKLRVSEDFLTAGEIDSMGNSIMGKMDNEKTERIIAALEELRAVLRE